MLCRPSSGQLARIPHIVEALAGAPSVATILWRLSSDPGDVDTRGIVINPRSAAAAESGDITSPDDILQETSSGQECNVFLHYSLMNRANDAWVSLVALGHI